ncbi:MAG: lactonase family protein [Lachnospiraceae bacterium]|nr:lactonase family protein [Lachnospiraceae bacterium]
MREPEKPYFICIGSWEHDRSGHELGIRIYRFSEEGFTLTDSAAADAFVGAMYFDADRKVLYCMDETETVPGKNAGGRVLSFAVDTEKGNVSQIGEVPACGSRTCSAAMDVTGQYLLVANHGGKRPVIRTVQDEKGDYHVLPEYDETNVVLYSLEADGAAGRIKDVRRHSGCGTPWPALQAHPHCVRAAPSGNLFCVCDKGADALYFYRIDYEKERIASCGSSPYRLEGGSAPRYCVFHPCKKFLYVNYEGKNQISAFRYGQNGEIAPIQTVDILPEDLVFSDKEQRRRVQSSDICIHPNGRYLYNITRGLNWVDVWQINQESGELTHKQRLELPAKQGGMDTIRGFALSPDARYLVVGILTEDRVVVLHVSEEGLLSLSEKDAGIRPYHPASLIFLQGGGPENDKNGRV